MVWLEWLRAGIIYFSRKNVQVLSCISSSGNMFNLFNEMCRYKKADHVDQNMRNNERLNVAVLLVVEAHYYTDQKSKHKFAQAIETKVNGWEKYWCDDNRHILVGNQNRQACKYIPPEYDLFGKAGGNAQKKNCKGLALYKGNEPPHIELVLVPAK